MDTIFYLFCTLLLQIYLLFICRLQIQKFIWNQDYLLCAAVWWDNYLKY